MCSQTFVEVLQRAGAQAKLLLYEGKTHTDIFLQVTNVDFDNEWVFMSYYIIVVISVKYNLSCILTIYSNKRDFLYK